MGALWLRFTPDPIPDAYVGVGLATLSWVLAVHALMFWSMGLYRGIWRYASLPDLRRILVAVGIGAIGTPTLLLMLQPTDISVPRSVFIVTPILLVLIMGGSRIAYRAWKEQVLGGLMVERGEPAVVIGSQEAAVTLIRDLARSPQWNIVGVFDDDPVKLGRQLHGVNVLGRIDEIGRWRERLSFSRAIIAMPEANYSVRRRALDMCNRAGVKVLTVPSYEDLVSGRITVSQVRHVELDDLLGRDPVVLDSAGLRAWLSGRVVMITGAGGS
ncbi:MAG TPA: hypothetical protein VF051_03355, partial [Hyphomicrobiaceae bacterium]